MKIKYLMNRMIMLFAFLLVTSTSFAQITTEEDMAKAVFETIKNNDSEAFSYYCTSDERMAKALKGVSDTSAMAKGVVSELEMAPHQSMKYAAINSFDEFISELKKENISLKDATFEGLIMNKIKFDINNLTAKKVKFKISFGAVNYRMMIYLFKTKTDMFIYDFSATKEDK